MFSKKTIVAENELTLRGKKLRTAIDMTYKQLRDEKRLLTLGRQLQLKPGESNPNDLSDVVSKYIPVGTSLEEAKEILVAAGFTVEPRAPSKPVGPTADTDNGISARIDPYRQVMLVSKTSILVYVSPKELGQYGSVGKIEAGIYVAYL